MQNNHRAPAAKRGSTARLMTLLGLALVGLVPIASAASLPVIGEFEMSFTSIGMWLVIVGIGAIVAGTAFGAALRKVPLAGSVFGTVGLVGGVVLLLIASFINPGGLLNTGDASASIAPAPGSFSTTPAAVGGAFNSNLYEPVSKVTWSVADKATHDGTGLSASVKLYAPGVTEKAAKEGTATPLYTKTTTDGSATMDGVQVQTVGCTFDVLVDLSGYYQEIFRNINLCREKNSQGLNSVFPPTLEIEKAGTLSLGLTPTSLTCTAGSQCSYTLVIRNSAANTFVHAAAVKFTNVANATLDSTDSGQACELVDVSGTKYVTFANNFATGAASCNVKLTRTASSADGSWTWTLDDNFQIVGATAWNTHTNVRGATATSATTVSFA